MYKIPDDIILKLEKKYPNQNIKNITHDLFDFIFQKTYQDGGCLIREFGRFIAYQTHSTKLNKMVIRFKFKLSPSLNKKIKKDIYLQNNLPIKTTHEFSKKHQEKCNKIDCIIKKQENTQALVEAAKYGKKKTHENLATDEIINIILNNEK